MARKPSMASAIADLKMIRDCDPDGFVPIVNLIRRLAANIPIAKTPDYRPDHSIPEDSYAL